MKRLPITTYIDLLFCVVILPMIIMLVPVDKWIVHDTAFAVCLIIYLYVLYFVYRRAKIPSLFMQKKYGHILLLVIVLVGVTELFTHFPQIDFPNARLPLDFRRRLNAQTVWFFFLVVSGFSLAIELTIELFRQMLSKQQIEAEKNKAELALYKAQINPHFLFNTLNALYGLVITKSDRTESAFVKFSDILKYMYNNASAEMIDVGSEINYIRQYVDLQLLRLNQHTHVVFEARTDDEQVQIPPMILITFVENAFKYGTSADEDCALSFRIVVENGVLFFEAENFIMKKRTSGSSPIGIENCRKRLELLYHNRFSLDIAEDQEKRTFKVYLNIQLR